MTQCRILSRTVLEFEDPIPPFFKRWIACTSVIDGCARMVIIRDGLHNDTRILAIKPKIHGQQMLVTITYTRAFVWSTYASVTPRKLLTLPSYNIYRRYIVSIHGCLKGRSWAVWAPTSLQWHAFEYNLHTFIAVVFLLYVQLCLKHICIEGGFCTAHVQTPN